LHWNLGTWFVFCCLADGTAVNIVFGKLGEARPPVFSGDKFVCFPSSGVAYGGVVMVQLEEVATEGVVFWDIDVAAIEDDTIFQIPVV